MFDIQRCKTRIWFLRMGRKERRMTYKELLNVFKDRFPFAKYEDYRPICHKLFTDGKVGITLFFENGDIIEYYPANEERKEE